MSLIQNKIITLDETALVGLFTENGGLGKIALPAPVVGKVNNILSISHWLQNVGDFNTITGANFLWYYSKFVEAGNRALWIDENIFNGNPGGGEDLAGYLTKGNGFLSTTEDFYLVSSALIDTNGSGNVVVANICYEVRDAS